MYYQLLSLNADVFKGIIKHKKEWIQVESSWNDKIWDKGRRSIVEYPLSNTYLKDTSEEIVRQRKAEDNEVDRCIQR